METFSPKFPILVDNIHNTLLYNYGASPERIYIVLDGKVVYKGDVGPMGYNLAEMEAWMKDYIKQQQTS